MMGGHGEYATGEKGLKMTLDSGVGYSMFFERYRQYLRHEDGDHLGGVPDPFRDVLEVERYHCGVVRHSQTCAEYGRWEMSGAAGTPVASEELAEEIRWFLTRNIKMALGIAASPAPGVILKVRILETGEYGHL